MRLGKEAKRDTQLVIISVLILTLTTLSVSYSAFFSVQSQSTVQKITTGELEVIIDGSSAMSSDELFPTYTSELPTSATSTAEGSFATLNLENTGTLDADFSVTLSYDTLPAGKTTDDLIAFDYLNIGIFDVANNSWVNFGTDSNVYYTPITSLKASTTNVYPILRDVVTTTTPQRQFKIYIWLSENTPTTEIGKLVYLKLDVKSATVAGQAES